jgi:hypothetical protein
MSTYGFSRPPPLLLSLHFRPLDAHDHGSASVIHRQGVPGRAGGSAAELERRMTLKSV